MPRPLNSSVGRAAYRRRATRKRSPLPSRSATVGDAEELVKFAKRLGVKLTAKDLRDAAPVDDTDASREIDGDAVDQSQAAVH